MRYKLTAKQIEELPFSHGLTWGGFTGMTFLRDDNELDTTTLSLIDNFEHAVTPLRHAERAERTHLIEGRLLHPVALTKGTQEERNTAERRLKDRSGISTDYFLDPKSYPEAYKDKADTGNPVADIIGGVLL
ncbi:hypothetical protein [Lentilactobacillus parakefiri]|uniref:Uncharacterized protein n=1 Tax=Lentilactobacillus parakefiri TaxID=152332 RepID=A0A224VF12_9LACO|nr:hypothetical protein [Lentilactobacillus parakefiri]KRL72011.1 hypothetical protein FD08_GL004645 [Lentilactobacillus parakefiri DSM 10551]PAL01037.1 hypothetical protein B8W96_03795 [Lentilactobacillus parakefiri]TDG93443.1 hypothetical protein C5L28_000354 [Lentilactobacillus parakefiri]GAW71051.1 hypothetical protein LPKJCM_00122 [Lentilactobacillus parakefiri]